MKDIKELLDIEIPIIQGAMAWISEHNLVGAVANTGATGVIAAGGRSADWLRDEIRKTKDITDKPFGVNIMLMADNIDDIVNVVIEEGIKFATLGAGNPVPYIKLLKEKDIVPIPVVPSLRLAKKVEKAGAPAIIIEGMEAGGHIGTQTTMALLTNIIPEVNIPVIAAGGIVDKRGYRAALMMGAQGVQMGSRFLLSNECVVHQNFKEAIIRATDTDSIVTGFTKGHGVRGLKNKFTEAYLKVELTTGDRELMSKMSKGTGKLAAIDGDIENGLVQVGQSLAQLNTIMSCQEIINEVTG